MSLTIIYQDITYNIESGPNATVDIDEYAKIEKKYEQLQTKLSEIEDANKVMKTLLRIS